MSNIGLPYQWLYIETFNRKLAWKNILKHYITEQRVNWNNQSYSILLVMKMSNGYCSSLVSLNQCFLNYRFRPNPPKHGQLGETETCMFTAHMWNARTQICCILYSTEHWMTFFIIFFLHYHIKITFIWYNVLELSNLCFAVLDNVRKNSFYYFLQTLDSMKLLVSS